MNLKSIRVRSEVMTVDGVDYVVTKGTGEMSFSDGEVAFAYYSEDVMTLDDVASYQDFCDAVSPIGPDDEDWLAVAVECARRGLRLTVAGSCTPALTDREYQIARMAMGL